MDSSGVVTELDLSASHTSTIVDRINSMPALKTSTAFFTFLRANLVLPHSAMSSNVSSPNLGPYPSQNLPPPSPSPLAANSPLAALDSDIPPLSLDILTTPADKGAALKLVADSIAQQRQQAAFHVIFHPIPLAVLLAVLAAISRHAWGQKHPDLGTTLILVSGVVTAYLLAIRYLTSGYLRAAEALSWDFLTDQDLVIGTRFGADLVGALVLRLERPSSHQHSSSSSSVSSACSSTSGSGGGGGGVGRRRSHHRQNSSAAKSAGRKGGKGVIRAWTTKLRYRGRGVGGDMLREAVRVTRERCGRDARVGFAREHANSVVVLPELFNRWFRKREMAAARALEEVLAEWEAARRR
ncbi:Acetyltransferase [Madurella fahalii]|uniref:Acetyltransferase n=1 Tax=Madurella fahalii TaxID=1157608 RepID=A0ABQ0GLH0_9PEZI